MIRDQREKLSVRIAGDRSALSSRLWLLIGSRGTTWRARLGGDWPAASPTHPRARRQFKSFVSRRVPIRGSSAFRSARLLRHVVGRSRVKRQAMLLMLDKRRAVAFDTSFLCASVPPPARDRASVTFNTPLLCQFGFCICNLPVMWTSQVHTRAQLLINRFDCCASSSDFFALKKYWRTNCTSSLWLSPTVLTRFVQRILLCVKNKLQVFCLVFFNSLFVYFLICFNFCLVILFLLLLF